MFIEFSLATHWYSTGFQNIPNGFLIRYVLKHKKCRIAVQKSIFWFADILNTTREDDEKAKEEHMKEQDVFTGCISAMTFDTLTYLLGNELREVAASCQMISSNLAF